MQVSLESKFRLRILLIENEDAGGLLHMIPKVIDPACAVGYRVSK